MDQLDKPGSDERPLEVVELEPAVQVPNEPYYFDDLKDFGWFPIAWSIMLAGAAYPNVVAAGAFFVMLLLNGPPSNPSPLGFILGAVMFAGIAGFVGIMWSGIVSLFTLPVLHLVLWSMTLRINLVKLGAFAGGLIGFIAVLPISVQIAARVASGQGADTILGFLLGPGLATVVGQLGGARGGQQAVWKSGAKMRSRQTLAKYGRLRPRRLGEVSEDNTTDEFEDGIDVPRLRFRTVHLLWLGVWFSLLLTLIRLSGIPFELVLPMLLVWLVYQAATLALGSRLLPRAAAAWQTGRQGRST